MGAGAIRLRTPVAGALRSIMVWGGICGWSACVRCSGKGAWNVVGGGEQVGARHLSDDACSGHAVLVNGLERESPAGGVFGMW